LKGLGGNLKPCGVADRRFPGQGKGLYKFYAGRAQAKFVKLLDGAGATHPCGSCSFFEIVEIFTIFIIVTIVRIREIAEIVWNSLEY